ncbi:MAG TPA: hypothetical protein VN723_00800 [Rhizomicrobium sp.]|nr:hypothetical protein [Rhizomicrobium sp.]
MPGRFCGRSRRQERDALVRKLISRQGIVEYGVLRFDGGLGTVVVPLPWSLLWFDPQADGYVANVDCLKLREAPHVRLLDTLKFDDEFACRIDAVYGTEFPGIEGLNDFA